MLQIEHDIHTETIHFRSRHVLSIVVLLQLCVDADLIRISVVLGEQTHVHRDIIWVHRQRVACWKSAEMILFMISDNAEHDVRYCSS